MNLKLYFLLIGLFLCSCKTKENLPVTVKQCLDNDSMIILNNGVKLFESKLVEKYSETSIEVAYLKYLNDLADKKINIDFFIDNETESGIKQVQRLNIWNKSNRSSENMIRESKIYNVQSMNPISIKLDAELQGCLIGKTESIAIKSLLIGNRKYRVSPRMHRKSLYGTLSIYDFETKLNRAIFVLILYYQIAFNVND